MFEALTDKFKALAGIRENEIIHEALDNKLLQAEIIDLNQSQLYDKGIQADGSTTGQYAPITITKWKPLALAEGRDGRSDHITGKDTGETYDSMAVINKEDSILITAVDRNNFFDREPYGLGLTVESIQEIIPTVKDLIIENIKQKI